MGKTLELLVQRATPGQSMNYKIVNERGETVGTIELERGAVEIDSQHADVKDWATTGVPALQGVEQDGVISEMPIIIAPSDDTFVMALLEELERRDWTAVEISDADDDADAVVTTSNEEVGDKEGHPFRGNQYTKVAGEGGEPGISADRAATDDPTLERKTAETVTDNVSFKLAGTEKVGGSLGGSSPAEVREDKDGTRWYVKDCKSEDHVRNEVLASRLYELAGVETPEVRRVDGEPGKIASKMLNLTGSATGATPGATEGFAADAWLANWDVAGKSYDNLMIDDKGNAVRVDMGGSLLFRAQGGSKGGAFGDEATEIDTLRDPDGKNPQSAKVFGGMAVSDVIKSIDKLKSVSDLDITETCKKFMMQSSIDGVDADTLANRLIARKNYLIEQASHGIGGTTTIVKKPKADATPELKITGKMFSESNKVPISSDYGPKETVSKPFFTTQPMAKAFLVASAKEGHVWNLDNWDDPQNPRPAKETGVPTNPDSFEYKRLVTLGNSMLSGGGSNWSSGWKGSAQSGGACALKWAVKRVFPEARGIVWDGSIQESDTNSPKPEDQYDNDRVVRMIYNDTQARLAQAGVQDKDGIKLWRGMHTKYTTPGIIEGYSYSEKTAKGSFNGGDGDVKLTVCHPTEVLLDNNSPIWKHAGFMGEQEWLVFAGGFGDDITKSITLKGMNKPKMQPIVQTIVKPGIKEFSTSGQSIAIPSTAKASSGAAPKAPKKLKISGDEFYTAQHHLTDAIEAAKVKHANAQLTGEGGANAYFVNLSDEQKSSFSKLGFKGNYQVIYKAKNSGLIRLSTGQHTLYFSKDGVNWAKGKPPTDVIGYNSKLAKPALVIAKPEAKATTGSSGHYELPDWEATAAKAKLNGITPLSSLQKQHFQKFSGVKEWPVEMHFDSKTGLHKILGTSAHTVAWSDSAGSTWNSEVTNKTLAKQHADSPELTSAPTHTEPAPAHAVDSPAPDTSSSGNWDKVDHQKIKTVMSMKSGGASAGTISKATNLAPATVFQITHGTSDKYTKDFPRPEALKAQAGVSEDIWKLVRSHVEQLKAKVGTPDFPGYQKGFRAIAKTLNLPEWKVQMIAYAKKKGEA